MSGNNRRGFTLSEMLVVLGVLVVVTALAQPAMRGAMTGVGRPPARPPATAPVSGPPSIRRMTAVLAPGLRRLANMKSGSFWVDSPR